ncbi:MAG TPA: hypothetical protein VGX25_04295 [Actinophytocola sp.]|uniref:hypothetical protein n=1 Tax=Actinophytocola sp. TaxID=1872138 RepID=UPI002DDD8FE1|nr:hypothetical protein [Actinophytocola sp.]HEV2778600.1 hypothetical protein [Actinophytocola sp.]
MATDVVGFGGLQRSVQVQMYLRACLYDLVAAAFRGSGIDFGRCYSEDRGDGFITAVPPDVPTTKLVYPFIEYVRAGLRMHNEVSSEIAKIRLRIALHSADAWMDGYGLVGDGVIHVFRLLEASILQQLLTQTRAYLAIITSKTFYDETIRHAPGLIDPDDYAEVQVRSKESSGPAWIRLLGHPTTITQSA